MEWYLPVIWAGIIGFAVVMYVVLDGFDLGIGILFPLRKAEADRDLMMNSVAPFWDGNETWLILGGGGLWVAFPKAYAVLMPAMYAPIIVMLLALVFRGVAFEFRWVAKPHHARWDWSFALGSVLATFAQGVVLGGLVQGVSVADGQFSGGAFDWLTPFCLFCGAALVVGYALLGACWLTLKTEGALADWAKGFGMRLLLLLVGLVGIVSIWTPLAYERIAQRWFAAPNIYFLWPVPLVTLLLAYLAWIGMRGAKALQAFAAVVSLFVLSFVGFAISTLPYIVPPTLTVWDAAAAPESQIFVLMGVLFLLPVILGYTVFVYWTFRGKLRAGEGYH
jgi:cytochrome bd ubiquinol oxidase subunit II